jgi:serine/threonine-protein kinase
MAAVTDGSGRWQRLEELVQAALERATDERAVFLAEACGGDEDLRREAASLIDRDARAAAFLATPIGELAANTMSSSTGGTLQPDESRDVIGRRIGTYEIRARLGAGGMGEVYRAHDHTLGRDVAIKVLPAVFSADPERLARFEREARLLASLSHPHIGAIYGLEGSGDVRALVLELIDGETLEARLRRGPIPAAHALTLAVQIAEALDHAHRQGVTHRDLKPGNVMLTKAGAKLLDFGLAKWGRGSRGYVNLSGAPPALKRNGVDSLTEEGMILGTSHYMAPEQLEGQEADARADVFAFGAVLYEMLTGCKAFEGGSAAAVMAAVLNTEPPFAAIQPLVPRSLERVIRKCLAKDPDQRWQTARDLADELRWIAEDALRPEIPQGLAGGDTASTLPAVGARPIRLGQVAALVAIASSFAGWAGWGLSSSHESSAPMAVTRFALQTSAAVIGNFDISPDGNVLVYAGRPAGANSSRLFTRRLDQFGDLPVAGTEGADGPFFSPDGRWVAFFSERRLLKVSLNSMAAPVLLCDGIDRWLPGATWLADGTIVFPRPYHGLQRVSAEGGEPTAVTSLSQKPPEFDHHSPSPLPGGRALLFTVHESDGRFNIAVQTLTSGERKVVVQSAYDARYVPSGHVVFARNSAILAVPFDLQRLAVTGPPVTLVENVEDFAVDGYGGYRLSATGTLVFPPATPQSGRTLAWVDRTGTETLLPIAPHAVSSPRVSPDGRRLAFAIADGGRRDIWTYDTTTEALARVTRHGDNRTPAWTRDGQRLIYTSMRGDEGQLFSQPADGSGAPERLVSGGILLAPGTWSADGRAFVYVDGNTGPAGTQMFVLTTDGERKPQPLLHGPAQDRQPSLSPDGRWLAFASASADTPGSEIYVAAFPSAGSRQQVSVEGGREPMWSRDGRELVYRSGRRMFAVPVDTTRGFSAGKPRVLFEGRYVVGTWDVAGLDYDLAPDGRFLMLKPGADEQAPPRLNVVLNWVDELKRRVPKTN